MRGEFESIGEQVFENLLEARHIGLQRGRNIGCDDDFEIQAFLLGDLGKSAIDIFADFLDSDFADFEFHFARLDFGQIEDFVDEIEKVAARTVNGLSELDLLGREVAFGVIGEKFGQNQHRIERRAQFVAHVGEKFRFIFAGNRELLGFFFQIGARQFDFLVFLLDFGVLNRQKRAALFQFLGLSFEFDIGAAQLVLLRLQLLRLRLQFLRERLGLFEQLFGSHVRLNHVQNDADAFR